MTAVMCPDEQGPGLLPISGELPLCREPLQIRFILRLPGIPQLPVSRTPIPLSGVTPVRLVCAVGPMGGSGPYSDIYGPTVRDRPGHAAAGEVPLPGL